MKLVKEVINDILSIIYPNRCIGCGKFLSINKNRWLCNECMPYFEIREYKRCRACGRIINHNGKCSICNSEKIYFDKGYSVFEYKGLIRNCILNFKYKNLYRYGEYLGKVMSDYAVSNIDTKFDYVTAVPLHIKRFRSRGYNQAEILAKIVAKSLDIEYRKLFVRDINTKPQSSLDKRERHKNIKGAFSMKNSDLVENKNILIIDDIFTTGVTINECCKLLKKYKARKVEFFTLSCKSED